MCELNPKFSAFFRLEAFTSNPEEREEEFVKEVMERVLAAEIRLNADGRYRFHVHEPMIEFEKVQEALTNTVNKLGWIDVHSMDKSDEAEGMRHLKMGIAGGDLWIVSRVLHSFLTGVKLPDEIEMHLDI